MQRLFSFLAAMLAVLIFALSATFLPGAMERIAVEFEVAASSLGFIFALQFAAFFLTTLWAGILADRWGMRLPLAIAAVLTGAGALTWGLATSIPLACLGAVLLGMGGGVIESVASALLSKLFPTRRKLMLNLSQVAYCGGAISGLWLMGLLLPRGISWRLFYLVLAGLCAGLLLLFLVARMPPTEAQDKVGFRQLVELGRRRSFYLPCLILFCYVFSETCVVAWCNSYLQQELAAPEHWAIWTISIVWGAMALGRGFCALIPESISFEKVIAGLMVAAGLAMVAQLFAGGSWITSVVLFGLGGLMFAGTWPLVVGLTAGRNPRYTSSVLGIVIASGALGCVFGPLCFSLLLDAGLGVWVWVICALPLFIGAGMTHYLARVPHEPLAG